jgi:hypothetical protein
MLILLNSLILFAAALGAHFMIWKIRLPRQQLKALLVIFAAIFLLWLIFAIAFALPLVTVLHIALFYGSVSLCYVIIYSGIEADSPSLSLMRFVAERRREGRSVEEVAHFLAQRPFVKARLIALQKSGLVREENGRYFISGKGSPGFRFILGYRKLYGFVPENG